MVFSGREVFSFLSVCLTVALQLAADSPLAARLSLLLAAAGQLSVASRFEFSRFARVGNRSTGSVFEVFFHLHSLSRFREAPMRRPTSQMSRREGAPTSRKAS